MSAFSRREILKIAAAAAGGAALQPLAVRAERKRKVGKALAHGLFFDEARLDEIKRLFFVDPFFSYTRETLTRRDRESDERFIATELRYNDQLFDLSRLIGIVEEEAFLYLMTGDQVAAQIATDAVEHILKFERWDFIVEDKQYTLGIQRAPAASIAVASASDWLGESLSDDKRKRWLTVVGERGCEACYRSLHGIRYPHTVKGWGFDDTSTFWEHRPDNRTDFSRRPEITQTTNLRMAPAAGLVVGACAIREVFGETDDVRRWLEMGTHTFKEFETIWQSDGSYHEGVAYANYTASEMILGLTALEQTGGPDVGNIVNWEGYVDYIFQMSMATTQDPYNIINFCDSGNPKTGERGSIQRCSVPFWIARKYGNGKAQWFGENQGGDPDHWSVIFYDSSVAPVEPEQGNSLWLCELDWIVARTGFTSDDLVVALRSGGPANHEHADRNGLVVSCFGEELITDPYRPPYSFADPAWKMRLTEGHSALLIDGNGHQHHNGVEGTNASMAKARIESTGTGQGFAFWTSDASQAYRLVDTRIKQVLRTVLVLFDVPAVIVADHVTKYERGSAIQARWFGYNWDGAYKNQIGDGQFSIFRPGGSIQGHVWSRVPVQLRWDRLDIPEERAVRHPFVECATIQPAMEHLMVTGFGLSSSGSEFPAVNLRQEGDGVYCTVSRDGIRFECRLNGDGTVERVGRV